MDNGEIIDRGTHEAGRGVVTANRRRIDGVTVIVGIVSMGNDSYNTAFRREERDGWRSFANVFDSI